MAVTRIKNNQITDSTITYAKIASGTLVGTNFNPELTLNSNVTILGNLSISGNSSTINSVNTYINDPTVVFNNGYTGSLSGYDIGFLVNRNYASLAGYGSVNTFFGWHENDEAFVAIATTTSGNNIVTVTNDGFANIKVGNLTANSISISTGTFSAPNGIINTPISGSTGYFTTAYATDFSTGNALITSADVTTLATTNFSTGNAQVTGGDLTGLTNVETTTAYASNLSSGNAQITGGSLTGLTNVESTTLQAGNFSSGNVLISGGSLTGLTNVESTTLQATNFSTGNARVTGGDLTGLTKVESTTSYSQNLSTGNAQVTGGSLTGLTKVESTTSYSQNLSTGNAQVTGGSLTGLTNVETTTAQATNFSTGNAQVTGGSLTGLTKVEATTAQATNFSTGNALITSADVTTLATTNFSTGNAQVTGGDLTGLTNVETTTLYAQDLSTGNAQITGGDISGIDSFSATTLQATNFSTGNAQVTGGDLTGLTNVETTTLYAQDLSTGNAQITGGDISGIDSFSATTLQATNFSTGNAQVTGGSLTGLTNVETTTAEVTDFSTGNAQVTGGSLTGLTNVETTTAQATNFSSGNAQITGGAIDGTPIGADTPDSGAFTTLTANDLTTITDDTESNTTADGALVVSGGVGIAKNLNVGGDAFITGNLTVQGTTTTVESTVVTITDLNLELAADATTNAEANGGGITVGGANATFTYANADDSWNLNKHLNGLSADFSNTTPSTSTTTGALTVAGGVGIDGSLYATSVNATSSDITTGYFESLNTANAVITGGYIDGVANVSATYVTATNFATGNAQITGGDISGITSFSATTLQADNFSTGNAQVTGGDLTGLTNVETTTLYAQDLSTGNAQVTGGDVNGLTSFSATTAQATNFSTGNAQVTGGDLTGLTNVETTTLYAQDLSTGNAQVTGGSLTGLTNVETTTAQATNFSTGNAVITGGDVNGLTSFSATTAQATNFSTGNAQVTGGDLTGLTNVETTTAQAANFSTGNAQVTGGDLTGLTNVETTTAQATNFSTGNAVITGGYADNLPIGANVAASGKFTTLETTGVTTFSGNLVANSHTPSTNTTTGAIVIPYEGGLGVGGNIHAGVYGVSIHNIRGNVLLGLGEAQAADSELTINLNPDTPMDSTGIVHISGNTGKTAIVNIDSFGTNAITGYNGRRARGTSASPTAILADDPVVGFTGRGYDGTAYLTTPMATTPGVVLYAAQNFAVGSHGTRLAFQVTENGNTEARRAVIIENNGNVVINAQTETLGPVSGALVVGGGVGVSKSIYVGGNLTVDSKSVFNDYVTANANVRITRTDNTTSSSTGALVVDGGVGIGSNVVVGGATTLNSNMTAGYDTIIKGVNDETLIWARPSTTYDQVVIGNSATVGDLVQGAKLIINSSDSILLPVGDNSTRPSNSGGTDIPGMLRYSTTSNSIEFFTGTTWQGVTTSFTVITDEQFSGDGITTDFTMGAASTTAATIVSINGVIQIPTLAYSVANDNLSFTEAPASGDVIDVRRLVTTQTLLGVASANGYMQFQVDNDGAYIYTGTSSASVTTSWNPQGAQVNSLANVAVTTANTATTIDTFDATKYRSAKYIVQVTNSSGYQVSEALVVHNGTTSSMTEYGIVQTNSNLGVLSTTISGSNVLVQFIAANATNQVRIKKDYNLI